MPLPRPALVFACVVLAGLGLLGWRLESAWQARQAERQAAAASPSAATAAETALPLPPDPPRLSADPEYDRCLAMVRDDPIAALAFAEGWERAGGGSEAARHCIAWALLGLGEPERAADQLERLALGSRAGATARAALFGQAGQAWMMAGQADRAFAAITMALTLTPRDPDLLVDRAVALASLNRHAEALPDLEAALAIDPDRLEALVFRAAALRRLERLAEARQSVERALALSPDHPEGLLERGILRQLAGDEAGARRDWERGLEGAPGSPAADLAEQNLSLSAAGPSRR
ncbi:MAG: tetratricopeptide repeat protein [Rhodovarius sp.]|nr:tetratricopeptide repeat protein [Rhodovarius sp.]